MKVTTIGFTKKSARRLLGLLRGSGVKRIVDVRLNNGSQLAGFAKKDDLAWFAREVVEPDEAAWDETGRVPAAAFREAAGRGAPRADGAGGIGRPWPCDARDGASRFGPPVGAVLPALGCESEPRPFRGGGNARGNAPRSVADWAGYPGSGPRSRPRPGQGAGA